MSTKEQKFFAKILLFGEYSILKGSDALTVPCKDYSGQLKFDRSNLNTMHSTQAKNLMGLSFYLKDLVENKKIHFDLKRLMVELEQGLYFSSNIPMGHGLGSSGALSAALYARYGEKTESFGFAEELKDELAAIESFYHKKSSGIDPLLSFFGRALYQEKGSIDFVNIPNWTDFKDLKFFLIDTEQSRQTDQLVDLFRHMDESGEIRTDDFKNLIEVTNKCIKNFLALDETNLFSCFKELSELQIKCLSAMVPLDFAKSWRELLKQDHSYLKLCGAGGGGFLLGVTRDLKQAETYFSNYRLEVLR